MILNCKCVESSLDELSHLVRHGLVQGQLDLAGGVGSVAELVLQAVLRLTDGVVGLLRERFVAAGDETEGQSGDESESEDAMMMWVVGERAQSAAASLFSVCLRV